MISSYTYVNVAVAMPLDRIFTYRTTQKVEVGFRVKVPFGNSERLGFVVDLLLEAPGFGVKDVIEVIDRESVLLPENLVLANWLKEYYFCSLGEALETIVPSWVKRPKRRVKPVPVIDSSKYDKILGCFELTVYQKDALERIKAAMDDGSEGVGKHSCKRFLLYGVTGSGKTEVYMRVVEEVIKRGKSAIVLLPEISLTPQIVSRFNNRFPGNIAIIHSNLTEAQRAAEWFKVFDEKVQVVIGTRSAVFAPVKKLGAIIIDEEYEATYKQESNLKYNTIDVALKRSEIQGSLLIMGSATPSVVTYYRARSGDFNLLSLPERIGGSPLPQIRVVNPVQDKGAYVNWPIISKGFIEEVRNSLRNNEQVLLFVNRRGYFTFLYCSKCKYVLRCPHCDAPLILHYIKKDSTLKLLSEPVGFSHDSFLKCHHCSFRMKPIIMCPNCNRNSLKYLGSGTQRTESVLRKIFPQVSLVRMDSDIMQGVGDYYEAIHKVWSGEAKVLLGTQMIAKGLDFPEINTCGILGIDTVLNLEDFRSAEWAFQLIQQIAGRVGRGGKQGVVFLETLNSEHYAIKFAKSNDYLSFFNREIELRKKFFYPPFSYLVRICFLGKNLDKVITKAEAIAELLSRMARELKLTSREVDNDNCDFEILGPSPCPQKKLKDKFRWQILIKTRDVETRKKLLTPIKKQLLSSSSPKITIDIDPVSLL